VKRNTTVARVAAGAAGLERIRQLAEQLAPAPVNSRQHRQLRAAIRIEANAYRKSLDTAQATATHDGKPRPLSGSDLSTARPPLENRPSSPLAGFTAAVAPRLVAEHQTMPLPGRHLQRRTAIRI
jgi:hypothetical protein